MTSKRTSIFFSSLIGMFGVALLAQALQIKPVWAEPMGPGDYPVAVSALLIVAALYNIIAELRKRDGACGKAAEQEVDATASTPTTWSGWRAPLAVGGFGVLYVVGLSFLGFFASTFLFTLIAMATLHCFEEREHLGHRLLVLYLPLSLAIVVVLYLGTTALRIYVPTQTWLW